MQEDKRRGGHEVNLITQLLLAVMCGLIGAVLMFVPQIDVILLCRILCIGMLIAAAVSITYYFAAGGYRRMQDVSFAAGILMMLLGICGLIRLDLLSAAFSFFAGIAVMLLGILILQGSMALMVMKSKAKIADFVLAVITLAGSVIIITDWAPVMYNLPIFTQIMMLTAGVFTLVSIIMTAIVIRKNAKAPDMPPPESGVPGPQQGQPQMPPQPAMRPEEAKPDEASEDTDK